MIHDFLICSPTAKQNHVYVYDERGQGKVRMQSALSDFGMKSRRGSALFSMAATLRHHTSKNAC